MNRSGRTPEWPIDPEADEPKAAAAPRRRGPSPVLIALGGLLLLLIALWLFTGNRNPDQDKLTNQRQGSSVSAKPEKLCASTATYDFIKRDLFRRAAQLRGSDQAAFDRLSSFAVVRMENPVMESNNAATGAVQCSGSLSLDLPPGVQVVGGRRTLTADVDYGVQPAADGSGNVVLLRNADAIITPLSTLARTAEPQVAAAPSPDLPSQPVPAPIAQPQSPVPAAPLSPATSSPVQPPRAPSVRPSFNCGNARTRGEIAVCNDPGLASLDRNMAAQFSRAVTGASPQERELLRQTAHRFYAFRDRCPDRACVADAYAGRIREIRDIAEGRWQPPQ
jgi:hypothetical protein